MEGKYFKKMQCLAVLLNLIVFGMVCACFGTTWYYNEIRTYQISNDNLGNEVQTLLQVQRWDWTVSSVSVENKTYTNDKVVNAFETTLDYNSDRPAQKDVIGVIIAFLVIACIGAGLGFILGAIFISSAIARNKVLYAFGANNIRLVYAFLGVGALLALTITIITLPAISDAVDSDTPGCNAGPCQALYQSIDNQDANGVRTEQQWGPFNGWWIAIVAWPIAVFAAIVQATIKLPIPVDSTGFGETL